MIDIDSETMECRKKEDAWLRSLWKGPLNSAAKLDSERLVPEIQRRAVRRRRLWPKEEGAEVVQVVRSREDQTTS